MTDGRCCLNLPLLSMSVNNYESSESDKEVRIGSRMQSVEFPEFSGNCKTVFFVWSALKLITGEMYCKWHFVKKGIE